jgi:hypothetical protein
MKKRVYSIIIFIFLLALGFIYLNKVFATRNIYVNVQEDFKKLAKQTNIDILFYGSSHSYTAYNPLIINKICKTTSYNLGSADLNISLTEMVLKETLKQTQPKLIVLEIYKGSLLKPISKKVKGYQLRALDIISNFSDEKYNNVKKIYNKDEYLGVYFPLIRNHSKWNEYNLINLSRRQKLSVNSHFFYGGYRGHYQMIEKDKNIYEGFKEIMVKRDSSISIINDQSKNDIIKFITTAKNKNIEVLIISSPDLRARFDNYRIFDELKDICESSGASFLNLNDHYNEMELSLLDFMDPSHLNIYGGTKATTFLAEYINENYRFNNKSSEASWQESIEVYNESKDLFVRENEGLYYQPINKKLLENTIIKSVSILKKNRKNEITITFDLSEQFKDDFKNNNLSFKIIPVNKSEVSEDSKIKGWGFDKVDIKLKEQGSIIKLQLNSKITDIEKAEIFLYNTEKYTGVIGEKITLNDISFKKPDEN